MSFHGEDEKCLGRDPGQVPNGGGRSESSTSRTWTRRTSNLKGSRSSEVSTDDAFAADDWNEEEEEEEYEGEDDEEEVDAEPEEEYEAGDNDDADEEDIDHALWEDEDYQDAYVTWMDARQRMAAMKLNRGVYKGGNAGKSRSRGRGGRKGRSKGTPAVKKNSDDTNTGTTTPGKCMLCKEE